jgi:hypothetical protein
MGNSSKFRGKLLARGRYQGKKIRGLIKNNSILFSAVMLLILGSMVRLWDAQPVFYAHAFYAGESKNVQAAQSPIFEDQQTIFVDKETRLKLEKDALDLKKQVAEKNEFQKNVPTGELAKVLYEIVGDAPIREMVPFISKRDEKVAAFLVGIAKKESSFGLASPSKNGRDCYNYWGYKGAGENGTAMGYACFASAEEAAKIVGDRIEVLVQKDRNTPARMVDTWKCGTTCKGDPGAPGWVSTVALYFNKIVEKNS